MFVIRERLFKNREQMYSSVTRSLQLLEILASHGQPLALVDIAQRMGTAKSGVHALLATLARSGFVEHRQGGIYSLGMKAWEIGRAVPAARLVHAAGPMIEGLVAEVNEGAVLGILDGFEVIYIYLAESAQAVRVHAAVGERIPAHCTSTGLALLATLDAARLDQLLPSKLPAFTAQTIVDHRRLRAELKRTSERGYAINRGGWRADVGGLAARIDAGSGLMAGLCVAAPLYRMTRPWVERTAPRLKRAAARVAAAMGAASRPPRRKAA
jgi:IclR family transcriptional regulator, KDG regulon repressor